MIKHGACTETHLPVGVVELGGPDDEGERLAHLVLGDVRPDVDVTRVPVQLEVLE